MTRAKQYIGICATVGLILTLSCDLASHHGMAPFVYAKDKHFAAFSLAGTVTVEWAGPTRIDRLTELGLPSCFFAADSRKPPFSWFMQRGLHIHLFWIELLLATAIYVCLLRPLWKRKRRKRLGLCSICEYQLVGVGSDRCPECGHTIPPGAVREEADLPVITRTNRIKRWFVEVPLIFILLLAFQFVAGATTRYEYGQHYALNPRTDVVLVTSGKTIKLIHPDGISYLSMTAISVDHWEYHAGWWAEGQPIQELRGTVCEGMVSNCTPSISFNIGNDTFEWSIRSIKQSWLYLPKGVQLNEPLLRINHSDSRHSTDEK